MHHLVSEWSHILLPSPVWIVQWGGDTWVFSARHTASVLLPFYLEQKRSHTHWHSVVNHPDAWTKVKLRESKRPPWQGPHPIWPQDLEQVTGHHFLLKNTNRHYIPSTGPHSIACMLSILCTTKISLSAIGPMNGKLSHWNVWTTEKQWVHTFPALAIFLGVDGVREGKGGG